MRRLIVNADDFGLTPGVNRAIMETNRSGVLTSATLMANTAAFTEAADMAKLHTTLKTGCHIVLMDGEPLCGDLPSLTQPSVTGGTSRFQDRWGAVARAAVQQTLSQDEIQREATAQICKIQAAGVTLTHVDTHKHTHIFPHVLRPVLRAAKARGIHAVRNPFEPWSAWRGGLAWSAPFSWPRALALALLQRFSAPFQKILREEGMFAPDGAVGIAATGHLNQERLTGMIHALPAGAWELVCHPGYPDAALQASGTRLLDSRRTELEILTSEETKWALAEGGIELISYADLQQA